jgi:Dyp-type peroxidase family
MTQKRSTGLGGITNLSVLAPIKAGMVLGFEPISYLERLRKVLDGLHSARQNIRESELRPPVFPDAVGRFGIIHHFRYAILPPVPEAQAQAQPTSGTWRLSLNVTFDGGWEPYMRVIYRDLGALLDLLFCHCDGYPGSRTSRFETYCAWVRRNEVESGIFYADSAMTLGDQQYLAEVERAQREQGAGDRELARLSLPSAAKRLSDAKARAMSDPLAALVLPMRTLKGLYRLSIYFPKGGTAMDDDGDRGTLRRFARSILEGPQEVMKALDDIPSDHPAKAQWAKARAQFADELNWLNGEGTTRDAREEPLPYIPEKLQSHILGNNERMTHGCVVLLRIKDKDKALTHFHTLASLCGPVPASGIGYLIAFTHAGLAELGISQQRLAAFPQEFIDGMEARCALLGDVRGNHPDHWHRPRAYGPDNGHRIDMKAVHALVQLRLADEGNASCELHDKLKTAVEALQEPDTGLLVLAVQALRSYRNEAQQVSGHFDFADGISQPHISTGEPVKKAVAHSDLVSAGELLLGHGNDRGDPPNPELDALQIDGSFLVVRKLRQRVDNLDIALAKAAPIRREDLLSKMMGRQRDGKPLVPLPCADAGPNDFNYASPDASDACPFQSHIRRANPRDGRTYTPRILRRGMSYGPKSDTDRTSERGVVFMAYCASIAEQFEALQRWIAGGNNSGVGSSQGDPFLRVPQAGETNTFRYLDEKGEVVRVVFDDKPFVQLEWGLYLFVPALPALRDLAAFRSKPAATRARPSPACETEEETQERLEEEAREAVRQQLDDHELAKAAWKLVRDGDPKAPQKTPYGLLVGRYEEVLKMMKDKGTRYSVKGYGERMGESIGLNLLGMDPGCERDKQLPLNEAVESVHEQEAFDLTVGVVKKVLGGFPDLPALDQDSPARRPIDLISFSDHVMAALCTAWIGLPEKSMPGQDQVMITGGRLEENSGKPRCPGNFATASRFIFSPHPRVDVQEAGRQQGQAVLKAVKDWLQDNGKLGKLAENIKTGLGPAVSHESFALSIAGVLLGFPPTVQGNFIRTLETWIEDEALWQHQQALFEATAGAELSYEHANAALRAPLLATMRKRPVPEMLWRSPVGKNGVDKDPKNRVVLGIASSLTDKAAPDELLFGRDRPGESPTVHGCPGYEMAMGVLLAMIAGLMKAGSLRPTGSPVLLILTPGSPA